MSEEAVMASVRCLLCVSVRTGRPAAMKHDVDLGRRVGDLDDGEEGRDCFEMNLLL